MVPKYKITFLLVFIILLPFLNSCDYCSFMGAHDLGNNLTLLEGDKREDRAIVYCTAKSAGCCYSGMFVIPSIGNQNNMYIDKAKSNNNWVIVKTIQISEPEYSYWIINKNFSLQSINCQSVNCDSLIQSHVDGPLDYLIFNKKIEDLKIDLKL